jgi:hypothetical protein
MAAYDRLPSPSVLSFELEVSRPRRDEAVRGAREALASVSVTP